MYLVSFILYVPAYANFKKCIVDLSSRLSAACLLMEPTWVKFGGMVSWDSVLTVLFLTRNALSPHGYSITVSFDPVYKFDSFLHHPTLFFPISPFFFYLFVHKSFGAHELLARAIISLVLI